VEKKEGRDETWKAGVMCDSPLERGGGVCFTLCIAPLHIGKHTLPPHQPTAPPLKRGIEKHTPFNPLPTIPKKTLALACIYGLPRPNHYIIYLMRKHLIVLIYAMAFAGVLRAQSQSDKLQLSLSTGYQREDFKWSIAGNLDGQNPNIYSELQWKKLGGQSIAASLQWNFWGRLLLNGGYERTAIKSGTVRDNDYNGDNRSNPAYDQLFDADKGFTRDIYAGIGYKLINTETFSLTPYAGYYAGKQSLHLYDRSGQYPDLNSIYDTDWKGPFVKALAQLQLAKKLSATATVSYTQADYNAKADWNLISSFQHPVSYRHTANGYGLDAGAGMQYAITQNIGVNIGARYFTWQTGEGVDELYLTSGESEKTQLNGVDRKGYKINLGIVLGF
jgi:opacity protein-like surface antigen